MAKNKLTTDEVTDLRYFWRLGAKPLDLAKAYGISPEAAYAHTTYRHSREEYRKHYYSSESEHVKQQRIKWQTSIAGRLSKYASFIKCTYGLSMEDKTNMFVDQNGLCDICTDPLKSLRLAHIDHNHMTGKVRALLCAGCNTRLAVVENRDFIARAEAYLKRWD